MPLKVIIAGAGIAGLATSISLRRISDIPDIDVQLYEQAPTLSEVGASIALSPNVCLQKQYSDCSYFTCCNLSFLVLPNVNVVDQ